MDSSWKNNNKVVRNSSAVDLLSSAFNNVNEEERAEKRERM